MTRGNDPTQPGPPRAGDDQALGLFHPAVRAWFEEALGRPTPAQTLGWPSIAAGDSTLILAPTGSGKTLAAFLACLNQLYVDGEAGRDIGGVRVLYVSPLKALNNDIHRNLEAPLEGIAGAARRLGHSLPELRTAVRTGDTTAEARRAMLRRPPQVLITTPESLYLILTSSQARHMLSTVRWVIVDEIHAVAGTKRGVHLALSLERVEALARRPVRIGLSATQRPLEEIARFLGGQDPSTGEARPVRMIDAGIRKGLDLQVTVTVDDLRILPEGSIWPTIHSRLYEWIKAHRSTLIFVNNRRLAERLTLKLNELAAAEIARTHHGSMSRAAREAVERDLKEGRLPCLVATSSLELGIDIGFIDLVIQVESSKSVARGLQRVGRAGHLVGASAKGRIVAKQRSDLLEAAAVARGMLRGEVEETRVPRNCLDVLAQQVVAMAAVEDWRPDDLYRLIRSAYPYRDLARPQFDAVLEMLSGRYPVEELAAMKPRITWDKDNGVVRGREGGRLLAIRGGGAIPDRGLYPVYLQGTRVKLGELDEEMVYESRLGDVFWLGSSPWRIEAIQRDRVFVSEAPGREAKIPFWKGEGLGRPYDLGRKVGEFIRQAEARLGDTASSLRDWLAGEAACDPRAAANLETYLRDQRALAGLPSDRRIIVERFQDELGDPRYIVHSPFGGPVHAAWSMAILRRVRTKFGLVIDGVWADDGMLFRLPESGRDFPPGFPLDGVTAANAQELILQDLAGSPLFGACFRRAAARALVLPRAGGRERTPLWLQRLRAADLLQAARRLGDYPVTVEAYREALDDLLEVDGLVEVLTAIESGEIEVERREAAVPSPFAANLLFKFIGANMYGDDTPRAERRSQMLAVNRDLLREVLDSRGLRELLEPRAIEDTVAWLQHQAEGRRARSADEIHDLLRRVGDLTPGELAERTEPGARAAQMLAELARSGRVRVAPALGAGASGEPRWVVTEDFDLYHEAGLGSLSAREALVRRFVRTNGPFQAVALAERYGFDRSWVLGVLTVLQAEGEVVAGEFTPGVEGREWCDSDVLQQLHRRTLGLLRHQMEPVTLETYQRYLLRRQELDGPPSDLRSALAKLRGLALPLEAWERDVLPARLPGYQPAGLDGLLASGEFVWVARPGGRLAFFPSGAVPGRVPGEPDGASGQAPAAERPADQAILAALGGRGASFTGAVAAAAALSPAETTEALLRLTLAGRVANDTFAPVRLLALAGRKSRRGGDERVIDPSIIRRLARGAGGVSAAGPAGTTGRWWALPETGPGQEAAAFWAAALLDRHGVVTREILAAEGDPHPWSEVLSVLKREEVLGRVRQGYFVSGLSGPQFAAPEAVEGLRELKEEAVVPPSPPFLLLSAYDPAIAPPANPVPRAAGNYVLFAGGRAVLAVEGHGRRLTPLRPGIDPALWTDALQHLAQALIRGRGPVRGRRLKLLIETWDGRPAAKSEIGPFLRTLGGIEQGQAIVLWASSLA
ncbi:MAG TPA: DEAD/DEAH box helicase [Bacillota bacterium]